MTDEEKRLEAEFEKLRDNAEKKTKGFSDTLGNMVDTHYFHTLWAVYKIKELGGLNEEKLKKHLNELKNRFTADKRVHLRTLEIQKESHERRMRSSELLVELVKNADELSLDELFEKIAELISNAFDDVSGKKVKKKLRKRRDNCSEALIAKNEGEGYIVELLQSLRKELIDGFSKRFTYDEAKEMIDKAKANGFSEQNFFKIKYEGKDRFSLYRI